MNTVERALLQAILDDPEDDGIRLIYADWLQEHGEEDVAAALRTSLASRGWWNFPTSVRARWAPWDACLDGWLGVAGVAPDQLGALPESPWLNAIDLRNYATDEDLRALARFPVLTALSLNGTSLSDDGLARLARISSKVG